MKIHRRTGSGTGEIVDCPFMNCDWDNSNRIWIKWKAGLNDCAGNVGNTLWSPPSNVTLVKRKTKQHVHAEFIKAWADDPAGVVIQYHNGVRWVDIRDNTPYWEAKTQYRIKPNTQKVKKYNFSYKQKNGDILTSYYKFTEEDFKKQFFDTGACLEYTRLDWTMQEQEVEV